MFESDKPVRYTNILSMRIGYLPIYWSSKTKKVYDQSGYSPGTEKFVKKLLEYCTYTQKNSHLK